MVRDSVRIGETSFLLAGMWTPVVRALIAINQLWVEQMESDHTRASAIT
ncbi:MAG TPA: hypothetical protein VK789_23045 [Bryobacteraceae bacterium]|nr:hypothetical protein [Bryobacteraceae bacterium]